MWLLYHLKKGLEYLGHGEGSMEGKGYSAEGQLCTEGRVYHQEVAHTIAEAGESIVCSLDWWAEDPGEPVVPTYPTSHLLQAPLLFLVQGTHLFVLLGPSAYSARPAHFMEDNLLYLKSTEFSV